MYHLGTRWANSASCLSRVTDKGSRASVKRRISRPQRDTARRLGHDRPRTGCTNDANGHIAAMAARYETLQEDEVIVPSSKGHTDASAAAMMKKWGKNGIPEGRSTWRPRGFLPRIAKLRTTSCVASAAASPSFVQLAPLCRASRSSAIAQHSRRDFVLASPLLP